MAPTKMWTDAYPTLDGQPEEIYLSRRQRLATLPEFSSYQERNPATAIHNRFRHHALNPGLGYSAGAGLQQAIMDPESRWHRMTNKGAIPAGLVTGLGAAALGGLLGGGLGLVRKSPSLQDAKRNARIGALLGGVLGSGLGVAAGLGHRTKSAYYRQSVSEELAILISQAPGLSGMERGEMIQASQKLSPSQAMDLIGLLRRASGFAAGAIIARFLLKAGVLGTIAGGLIGHALGPKPRKPYAINAFGESF